MSLFYVDFNNRNGRRCATDVELEIEKLKKEDVDGIILDLRNNGGGYYNHDLFWRVMGPNGGGNPSGALADAINEKWNGL